MYTFNENSMTMKSAYLLIIYTFFYVVYLQVIVPAVVMSLTAGLGIAKKNIKKGRFVM